jgi:hypothetical protein
MRAVIGAPQRRITSTLPSTTASVNSPCMKAFTMSSGPMPAASPMVTSSGVLLMPDCRSR